MKTAAKRDGGAGVHAGCALSDDERRAIAALKRLAKRWPETLFLFSADGALHVMRKHAHGVRPTGDYAPLTEAYDPAMSLATIDIPNDGGDW